MRKCILIRTIIYVYTWTHKYVRISILVHTYLCVQVHMYILIQISIYV